MGISAAYLGVAKLCEELVSALEAVRMPTAHVNIFTLIVFSEIQSTEECVKNVGMALELERNEKS